MKITGGELKGRVIPVRNSPHTSLRPTSDKMRQAIFNFLHHNPDVLDICPDLEGVSVLDAFCGTGALGLEAISHGASHAVFFDTDHKAISELKALSEQFKISDHVQIQKASALRPPQADQSVDLVFLDPPYNKGLLAQVVPALSQAGWVGDNTLFVCEAEKECRDIPLRPIVDKTYGDSRLLIGQMYK